MTYFLRGTDEHTQIAIAEDPKRAAALRDQGWREVERDIYMAWWTFFDAQRFWEARRAIAARRLTPEQRKMRVVGEMF